MYEYRYTELNGFKKIKVSKELHNKLFKHRKRSWKHQYVYMLKDDSLYIEQHCSWLVIFLIFLLLPVHILINGLGNIKEVWKDTVECIPNYARKSGSFVCDRQHNWSQWLRENTDTP